MPPLSSSDASVTPSFSPVLLGFGSLLLAFSLAGLLSISGEFAYGLPWAGRPTVTAVALMMAAGTGYLIVIWALHRQAPSKVLLAGLFAAGVLFRLMWLGSTPIYEDDFYRYFFDGAMVSNGLNPYVHTPVDALPDQLLPPVGQLGETREQAPDPTQDALRQIAETGQVDRVAYPYIRTIYPPVSQAFFALHHMLAPWSLDAWRVILFAVDTVSLLLLAKLVRLYGKPVWMTLVFWLNPLVITETMNAGHMDALLIPFLVGAVFLAQRERYGWAGMALAGAVGVKIWPLILAPLLFAKLLKSPKRLIAAASPFAVASGLLLLPQLMARLDSTSGLAAYAEFWQVNALLFPLIEQLFATVSDESSLLARLAVAGVVGALALKLSFDVMKERTTSLTAGFLTVTAALFLLSPTGYPWYFIWFVPWLAVQFSPALLLLSVLLPLYDLRYPMSLDGNQSLFDTVIVPIEFLPTLVLLVFAGFRHRRSEVAA